MQAIPTTNPRIRTFQAMQFLGSTRRPFKACAWLAMVPVMTITFAYFTDAADPETSKSVAQSQFPKRQIIVNGNTQDWKGIPAIAVHGENYLWFGQGMTREKWLGDDDLSYQWRGAWSGHHLYFLIEVTDDHVMDPIQQFSYLCDCVEIYLDYDNRKGRRVKILDERQDWFERYDPAEMMGYELHFLPADPPPTFLHHRDKYAVDKPQHVQFKEVWHGEAAFARTAEGYRIEVGLTVPGVDLCPGKVLGVEIGVCDDDGKSRESIMMWTGTKSDFWTNMGEYGEVTLQDEAR